MTRAVPDGAGRAMIAAFTISFHTGLLVGALIALAKVPRLTSGILALYAGLVLTYTWTVVP